MIGPEIRERVLHSSGLVIALACACTCTLACTERSELLGTLALHSDAGGAGTSTSDMASTDRGQRRSGSDAGTADAESASPAPPRFATPVLVSALF